MEGSTRAARGILQVHPTRLCNLECVHCYSASSPAARARLAPDIISLAIEDVATLGFDVVSLSGGEPLLYDGLSEVLQTAKRAVCRVNIVSNGILIGSSRYERCADAFSLIALSVDGLPARHNAVRRSAVSFERVRSAARVLRDDGRTFGIIHTLTSESLDEVEELAAMAAEWGASLLQLHPFEPTGRGRAAALMTPLSESERIVSYLLAAALAASFPQMRVQLDLVHRDVARCTPDALEASPLHTPAVPSQLVLQEDGTVVPLTYGLDPRWAVANLRKERLAVAWPDFLQTRWTELRRRVRAAAIAVARGRYGELAEWHSIVRQYAAQGFRSQTTGFRSHTTALRPAASR